MHVLHLVSALALASCAGPASATALISGPVQTSETALTSAEPDGAAPRVEVTLASASRVLYSPPTLRAPRPAVRVTITNSTRARLDVSRVRVRLDVRRGGIRVPCERISEPDIAAREPVALAPGASATYLRTVDCPLSLAGRYDAQVIVGFGAGGEWSGGRPVRELTLVVAAPTDARPRPIAAIPGVFAAVGAGPVVPTTYGKGARLVVLLVNARSERVALPPLLLAVRVTHVGTAVVCEDEPAPLVAPASLEGGAAVTRAIDVSCLGPGAIGTYEIAARLLVEQEGTEHDHALGSLRLEVTNDPSHMNRRMLP
jgi:hypothetical protein